MRGWLKQRGTEPPVYSPIDEDGNIVVGMAFMGEAPGHLVGEFWFNGSGKIGVKLYAPLKAKA